MRVKSCESGSASSLSDLGLFGVGHGDCAGHAGCPPRRSFSTAGKRRVRRAPSRGLRNPTDGPPGRVLNHAAMAILLRGLAIDAVKRDWKAKMHDGTRDGSAGRGLVGTSVSDVCKNISHSL